jgi:hypothetical protein
MVPPIIIMMHVPKSSIDSTLSSYSVRPSWKQFADASCVEACFCEPNCSAKACTSGSNDEGVIVVVYYRIASN